MPQWHPSASALSSMHPGCRPSVPHPSPTHNPDPSSMRKHKLSLFYHFHIVVLVVDSVRCHSCIFPKLYSASMTSVSLCTIPQTRPTKLALRRDKINLIRIVQRLQLCHIHVDVDARVYSQAPSSS